MSLPTVNHAPLTDAERSLIRAAETQAWTEDLTAELLRAVRNRGVIVDRGWITPDGLIKFLEQVAREQ